MHQCRRAYIIGVVLGLFIIVIGCLQGFCSTFMIDAHEHIESVESADKLLEVKKSLGIKKTILVATPTETLTLNGQRSFTGYRENMEELFKISEKYPNHFIPFCTVSPMDSDALEYFRECVAKGGQGLKLYNGHSYYHPIFGIPLDSPRMHPIYAYAQRNKLPVLYHVNITKYNDELEKVLLAYPDLVVSVPHFMVSSAGLSKVEALLNKYPNLYTDISFGSPEFLAAGFRRISRNMDGFSKFFNNHHDRILFGADLVITNNDQKSIEHIREHLTCYRDLLKSRKFTCKPVAEFYAQGLRSLEASYQNCQPKEGTYCESLKERMDVQNDRLQEVLEINGLNLAPAVLQRIFWANPNRFLRANQ